MKITRTSPNSGRTHTLDLPVTEEQMENWKNGMVAQRAFPHLTPDQREFIMTGITAEEWDEMFKEEDD